MTVAEYRKARQEAHTEWTRLSQQAHIAKLAYEDADAMQHVAESGAIQRLRGGARPEPGLVEGDALVAEQAGWDEQDALMRRAG